MMKGLLGPQEAQSEIHNGKNFGKKKRVWVSLSQPSSLPSMGQVI